jgi:hypothetical protein
LTTGAGMPVVSVVVVIGSSIIKNVSNWNLICRVMCGSQFEILEIA